MHMDEFLAKFPFLKDHGGNSLLIILEIQQWVKGEAGWTSGENFEDLNTTAGEGEIYFESVVSRQELGETQFKATFYMSQEGWERILTRLEQRRKGLH